MSSTRVVVGTDERGRPLSEWRTTPGDDGEPRYAFMEPAHASPIERRKATPEELAAAKAREDEPNHLVLPTVGSPGVTVQRAPALQPVEVPEEEPSVSEQPTKYSGPIPVHDGTPLARLVQAASLAAETHERKQAAETAWELAREALARAYGEVEGIVERLPLQPEPDQEVRERPIAKVDKDRIERPIAAKRAGRSVPGGHVERAEGVAERARLVKDALERHGGDTKAAGRELGMRGNVVALIAKRAERRDQAVTV